MFAEMAARVGLPFCLARTWLGSRGLLTPMHPWVSVVSVGPGMTRELGDGAHTFAGTARPLPWPRKAVKLLGQRPPLISKEAQHGQGMEETPPVYPSDMHPMLLGEGARNLLSYH